MTLGSLCVICEGIGSRLEFHSFFRGTLMQTCKIGGIERIDANICKIEEIERMQACKVEVYASPPKGVRVCVFCIYIYSIYIYHYIHMICTLCIYIYIYI